VFLDVILCWFIALLGQLCVGTVKVGGSDGARSMRFKTPNISDEEAHSDFMPEQLKCDACRIVAYQVSGFSYLFDSKRINITYRLSVFVLQC